MGIFPKLTQKKGSELDKKKSNLDKKRSDLDKKKQSGLDKSFLSITSDQSGECLMYISKRWPIKFDIFLRKYREGIGME